MGLNEEGESEGLPGLGMGIMVEVFQVEGKVLVDHDRLKIVSRRERHSWGR